MKLVRFFWIGIIFGVSLAVVAAETEESNEARVIVLANASDSESVKLAEYYCAKRAIPEKNIIALPMSGKETITWPAFIASIFQPLQDRLIDQHWIDAIGTDLSDPIGRKKYAISGHRISYLVVVKGVPLRIEHDGEYFTRFQPQLAQTQFQTNAGAVDSELSLLAAPNYPINALVPNPLYGLDRPTIFQEQKVVKVSRLDGPNYASATALVDHALEGEKWGLIGRAYVDIGGPHKGGDAWFEETARRIEAENFDLSVDRTPATFPAEARFDCPALYFGWYNSDLNGPFNEPGFHFPPGAIALHLHSYSAVTLKTTGQGWTGPLIARGVTATVGNVNEPYMEFTHQPQLIVRALFQGKTWGDAAYESMRALSWQCITIGDPLYRPFAKSFAEEWSNRDLLPDALYPYVVLRELRRLEKTGSPGAALSLVQQLITDRPSLPLAIKWIELAEAAGKKETAIRAARSLLKMPTFSSLEIPMVVEAGATLMRLGETKSAVEVFARAIREKTISPNMRRLLYERAIPAARAAHDEMLASKWAAEASELPR